MPGQPAQVGENLLGKEVRCKRDFQPGHGAYPVNRTIFMSNGYVPGGSHQTFGETKMKRFWNFLNQPLVAIFIGHAILISLIFLLVRHTINIYEDKEQRIEALSRLELSSMQINRDEEGLPTRCVGTLKNNSQYTLIGIEVALLLYDSNDQLIDVVRHKINNTGFVQPSEDKPFSVAVFREWSSLKEADEIQREIKKMDINRVELKFIDLDAFK